MASQDPVGGDAMDPSKFLDNPRLVSWEEIFGAWQKREEEVWRTYYTSLGFASWDEWRQRYISLFVPENRVWTLYDVIDPGSFAEGCVVGAFRGWRKYYPGPGTITAFGDLVMHAQLPENKGVAYALNHMHENCELIGFRQGRHLVIRDGTHHASAMAYAKLVGTKWSGKVTIALSDFSLEETKLMLMAMDQQYAPSPSGPAQDSK